jgi:hypothetical protein
MQITVPVTYFASEGRANLPECLRLTFEAALLHSLNKIVIFTAVGEGLQLAIDGFIQKPEFAHIRVIAVTFAQGTQVATAEGTHQHEFPQDVKEELIERRIPLIRANLPFSSITPQHARTGVLAQDMSIVGNALNIFGGGMSLCIQGVLLACDAGEIAIGEHVLAMTADTSLIVRAAPTRGLLTDLIVRQVICKPAFMTISKSEPMLNAPPDGGETEGLEGTGPQKLLEGD